MADVNYKANAFLSCSLREEDEPFVNYVCSILEKHEIRPFGTVGKFSASPENPVELMKKNIPQADIVVIVATPRYLQRDIKSGAEKYGLSEMVHVETGMAIAHGKPVVVFVKEGTDVGSVIPNITQYVILNEGNYGKNRALIYSLLNSAYSYVKELKNSEGAKTVGKIAVRGLAMYGFYRIIKNFFDED